MKKVIEATNGLSYIVENLDLGWAVSDSNGSLGVIAPSPLGTPLPELITMHVGYRHLTADELAELNRNCDEQIARNAPLSAALAERKAVAYNAFNTK